MSSDPAAPVGQPLNPQLRRLLPAPVTPPVTPPEAAESPAAAGAAGVGAAGVGAAGAAAAPPRRLPAKRRLEKARAACTVCRKQKAKCTGERPSCRRCVQRRYQCQYSTQPGETEAQATRRDYMHMRERASAHEEVFDLLKSLPQTEAQGVLHRIRAGTDVDTILSHVKAGDVLLQMAVAPETRFRYEFPYKAEIPAVYLSDNPYLESLLFESAGLYPGAHGRRDSSVMDIEVGSEGYQDLYLKPFHAAQLVDPLLSSVKPSVWTNVCQDDVLMRDLLSVWLRCEHHFTAIVQKDLFLEDMAAQRTDFCSSLLVNVALAYACVCYPQFSNRVEYWNPNTLHYRFLAEAKRLWELEAIAARITTVQAGVTFNVIYNLSGLDQIGHAYRIHAVALAHQLHLFDIESSVGLSERMRRGRAYTAWALYNWEALTAFSFLKPPLLTNPPPWVLPDPAKESQFYGEMWVKYPLSNSLSPSYFGLVFKAKSQFRIIMSEFCQIAYDKDLSVTVDKAYELYWRMRAWFGGLPLQLTAKRIALPGHLQLHIYYHHLLLTIFEPLLDTRTDQQPSPQQIVADAKRFIQTLIRLYYLRHGFEAMDLFIVIPLILAGYDCLDAIDDETPAEELETLRSTLLLVAKGLYNQRHNHYLAEALYRVIRGRMRAREAALLREAISLPEDEPSGRAEMVQAVRSHWPVSVVRRAEDMDGRMLGKLVESYAGMQLEGAEGGGAGGGG